MEDYQREFIDFMVDSHVLKFGSFTLKSGRQSPFFMNAGAYVTGNQLRRLGEYYAKALADKDYTSEQAYEDIKREWENMDYEMIKEAFNEKAAELGL